jgi:hypothetical protein
MESFLFVALFAIHVHTKGRVTLVSFLIKGEFYSNKEVSWNKKCRLRLAYGEEGNDGESDKGKLMQLLSLIVDDFQSLVIAGRRCFCYSGGFLLRE